MKSKATYLYTYYENGIRYCCFKYRGYIYDVCYNAFHCWHDPIEQHKFEQSRIDAEIERSNTNSSEDYSTGFDLFWDSVEGRT